MFKKICCFIKFRSKQIHQTIHTSTDQSACHEYFIDSSRSMRRIRFIQVKFLLFSDIIRCKRMFFILQGFLLISTISLQAFLLTTKQCKCIFYRCMPRLHAKCCRTWTINRSCITDRCQQISQISIIRISHKPFRICFL